MIRVISNGVNVVMSRLIINYLVWNQMTSIHVLNEPCSWEGKSIWPFVLFQGVCSIPSLIDILKKGLEEMVDWSMCEHSSWRTKI